MILNCTHKFSQIFLGGVQEIVGSTDLQAALNMAGLEDVLFKSFQGKSTLAHELSFQQIYQLEESLCLVYGKRGGDGVSLRAGRAAFKFVMETYGKQIGLADLEFRLLPSAQRIKKGLDKLASLISEECHSLANVTDLETAWQWRSSLCPWSFSPDEKTRSCYFLIGLLQEYCQWVSGGKYYSVSSPDKTDQPLDVCLILIDKKAVG